VDNVMQAMGPGADKLENVVRKSLAVLFGEK
jgi:hypothetical protein